MLTESKREPGLTVGVITHDRSTLFTNLLTHLKIAIEHTHASGTTYGPCSLLVCNNSGITNHEKIQQIVHLSGIEDSCQVRILDSDKNNIAVGRNLILDNTHTRWLIFVDDDEYPIPEWICALVDQQEVTGCSVVAGPIEPVYPSSTPGWVASLDLHNKGNLKTNDRLRRVATGNCLIDLSQVGDHRFDPAFGLSGGSDALFFDQMAERGLEVVWREDAVVYETIPASRTSSGYMIFRCMTQGQNFKRVILRDAGFSRRLIFTLKACAIVPPSLLLGALAFPISKKLSAHWLKRGFTNLGKLIRPSKKLYG